MANLVPLTGDKKPFVTADGSFSYYNLTYNEAYHAKSIGAYTESLHKFVYASGILEKLRFKDVWLLDICFGLGYNLATLINEYLKRENLYKLRILSLEKDPTVVDLIENNYLLWPAKPYNILRKLIKNEHEENFDLKIIIDDATAALEYINFPFDIVFFDPFSKSKNPEMWNTSIFKNLYKLLKDDGCIVTYACSSSLRSKFYKAGFLSYDTKNLPNSFQKGTLLRKFVYL